MKSLFRSLAIAALSFSLLSACGDKAKTASDGDMDLGNPASKVTLIEYASVTCSHCARFDREVWPALKAKYIDTGKIHYVFKEFLTPPVPVAAAGFVLARCAGKDKYFQVIEALFRAQDEMFATGDFRGPYLRVAKSVGMTEDQFNACLNDSDALNKVNARVQRAVEQDKIEGTPNFLVNGKQVATGETTIDKLSAAIDAAQAGK